MPLGHLGINVSDLAAARAYYDALMPLVGYEPYVAGGDQFAYRPADGKVGTYIFFYPAGDRAGYSRDRPGLQHLAFMVRTRSAVDHAFRWAAQRGDTVLHPPREFPEYPPPYYAAFWTGPDGLLLEVVCHAAHG
ncbi:VOC family protein [Tsukamurella tyrosinosolvens]|uniref:VOC family protein n=1 Tax=Tsukamurella tyrosinosolvens TaxID=57704 RepID=UPI0007B215DD|nr:VOC family protein [Tsukamurella tyrosinosolvens]KZL97413.1 extradiol dioxygenase [Tsukamurella tyrosinosolvens]MCA4996008.1 VOC family protein [Tsukamurella tyrosinosolvens]WEL91697.1 VOC family protein [Tsukamurella tyrosinosolvens]